MNSICILCKKNETLGRKQEDKACAPTPTYIEA